MFGSAQLTIFTLLRTFKEKIALTWALILSETVCLALIPLFIGFAIDGLLSGGMQPFWNLTAVLFVLVLLSVARRAYDTRVFGAIRVHMGEAQAERSRERPVSSLTARLGMGRELVNFLEEELPEVMTALVQLVVSMFVLYYFDPALALASGASVVLMLGSYALFHDSFFRLNSELNQQQEAQVDVLEKRRRPHLRSHLLRLRSIEVKISDNESILYGLIFIVLLGLILFNLWFAATHMETTSGTIFSIISYSWEFVESALALPIVLQSWSRLSEITQRINQSQDAQS